MISRAYYNYTGPEFDTCDQNSFQTICVLQVKTHLNNTSAVTELESQSVKSHVRPWEAENHRWILTCLRQHEV